MMHIAEESQEIFKKLFPDVAYSQPIGFHLHNVIINNTGEPIYVIDHDNLAFIIQPVHVYGQYAPRCLIQATEFDDPRSPEAQDRKQRARTVSIEIDLSTLRKGPVFVKSIGKVICTPEHLFATTHPNYSGVMEVTPIRRAEKIMGELTMCPISIVANDPSGQISCIYMEINGVICPVAVENDPDAPLTLMVGYRTSHNPDACAPFNVYKVEFSDFSAECRDAPRSVLVMHR
jgi:hypothetical protein